MSFWVLVCLSAHASKVQIKAKLKIYKFGQKIKNKHIFSKHYIVSVWLVSRIISAIWIYIRFEEGLSILRDLCVHRISKSILVSKW